MLKAALATGFLLSATPAEPRLLDPSATSVLVYSASARLIPDGSETPDGHLTLLPEGVYFTREGHDRLVAVTVKLQEDMGAIRRKVLDYEAASIAPPPVAETPAIRRGWSTSDLLVAVLAGVVLGAGGLAAWQAARAP